MKDIKRTPVKNKQQHLVRASSDTNKETDCNVCNTPIPNLRSKQTNKCYNCNAVAHLKCTKVNNSDPFQCGPCSSSAIDAYDIERPNLAEYINQADELSNKPSNRDIITLMKGILQSQDFVAHQFDQYKANIQAISQENKILKQSVAELESRIVLLENGINIVQQKELQNKFLITGLPINENLEPKVIIRNIGNILNVPIQNEDIVHAKFFHPKNKASIYAPLLVEVDNIQLKSTLMNALKQNGPILSEQLNLPNHTSKVFIKEYLTEYNSNLLNNARVLKSDFSFKYVWFKNNSVWARKTDSSNIIRINDPSDMRIVIDSQRQRFSTSTK